MKTFRKLLTLMLASCLACTMFASIAEAASAKKTIYVVSSIKINQSGQTTTGKITYNNAGFITKTNIKYPGPTTIKETFSYDGKYQMKKYTKKTALGTGTTHWSTQKYTWKNGVVNKEIAENDFGSRSENTYKYNSKKQVISGTFKDAFYTLTNTYKYKKGKMVQVESSGGSITQYTYDSKGNITKISMGSTGDAKISTYETHKLTYESGNRIKKLVRKVSTGGVATTFTYTYKKITVDKANADAIAEQQWKLVNGVSNEAVGFQ